MKKSPQQAELAKLMPVLGEARVNTATRQAAVWIVTDNANYNDLGVLVARNQYDFVGRRIINELEAARAMKICDEAGINITRKAIWRDRKQVISGLEDAHLKKWLEEKK